MSEFGFWLFFAFCVGLWFLSSTTTGERIVKSMQPTACAVEAAPPAKAIPTQGVTK